MAETKECPECGAEVSGDAQFCPECGASLTPTKQAARAQTYSRPSVIKTMFSKSLSLGGTIFGIVLAWLGRLINVFADPGSTAMDAARVLDSLGFMMIGVFLVGGGISNSDMNEFVRLGMVLGGILSLALAL